MVLSHCPRLSSPCVPKYDAREALIPEDPELAHLNAPAPRARPGPSALLEVDVVEKDQVVVLPRVSAGISAGKVVAGLALALGICALGLGLSSSSAVSSALADTVGLSTNTKENSTANSTKANATSNATANSTAANTTANATAKAAAKKAVKKEVKTESANTTTKAPPAPAPPSCRTAQVGEPCYQAVMWHKWIGLVENPTWYQTISRQSNRHQIQQWLFESKQGSCQRPCDGAYPVPQVPAGQHPRLYCFSVARLGSEMDTMFMQRQAGAGIFGCDGFDVFSDQHVDIDGYQTKLIPSTASGVSVDRTAANSQVFMKTWLKILNGDQWWRFDFIAKVDPDAVLFADRLRGHLSWHTGQNVFFLNCAKYIPATMYGALEVFSKSALGAYLSQHGRCESQLPFWSWGEDRYMANCLESLGVATQPDYLNFLHDERCWGVDCGNKNVVAFHSFKYVNTWMRCYLSSK